MQDLLETKGCLGLPANPVRSALSGLLEVLEVQDPQDRRDKQVLQETLGCRVPLEVWVLLAQLARWVRRDPRRCKMEIRDRLDRQALLVRLAEWVLQGLMGFPAVLGQMDLQVEQVLLVLAVL